MLLLFAMFGLDMPLHAIKSVECFVAVLTSVCLTSYCLCVF